MQVRLYSGYSGTTFGSVKHLSGYPAVADVHGVFPEQHKKQEAQDMIFALQDKLVLKELYSARLYYNLGNYLGNNYESCVITAQNALKGLSLY